MTRGVERMEGLKDGAGGGYMGQRRGKRPADAVLSHPPRSLFLMKHRHLLSFAVGILLASPLPAEEAKSYDIVVYGGTSGGVTAAIQSARMGKTVVLIEPTKFLGGLTTGGLGATDIGNKKAIGGMAREFYHRIWEHYQNDAAWNNQTRQDYRAQPPD